MENEIDVGLTNSKANNPNIFLLDYKGQKLKNNSKFEEWKKKRMEIYGNNAKLFKCKRENAYFYVSYENCKKLFYLCECPSCQSYICYFCSNNGNCCTLNKIIEMIYDDGFSIIHPTQYHDHSDYLFEYMLFLIPICTLFLFIGVIGKNLYHVLHKIKNIKNGEYYYFRDDNFSWTIVFINALVALMLSINYAIIDIYLKIILLIISLPFKNYPIKIYLGIIRRGITC